LADQRSAPRRLPERAEAAAGGNRVAPAAFFLVIWLALLAFGRNTLLQDPGTFWHLVLGERLLAAGEATRYDSFTFTFDGQPWLSLQWLGEAAMATAFRAGGWDTLLLLTVTVLATTYAWLAGRLMRGGLHWLPTAVLVAIVIAASSHHFHARPHVATIAFLGITVAWLSDVESRHARLRRLWLLVPVFVLWTNIHGGVLGGLVTVGIVVGGGCLLALVRRERTLRCRDWLALAALVLCLASSLLANPYGLEMPRAWLRIMAMPLPEMIQEHRPLSLLRPEGWMVTALAAAYLGLLIDAWVQRRMQRQGVAAITWLVPLVWLCLTLGRVRHAPLFAIAAAVVMADILPHTRLARWLAKWELFTLARRASEGGSPSIVAPPSLARRARVRWWLLAPLLAVATGLALQVGRLAVPVLGHNWARHDDARWPVELLPELRSLEAERPGARLINALDFGGFVAFHAPRLKTFIDDRCELFGGEFLADYAEAEGRRPERIDEWAAHYDCEAALVRARSPFDRYLRTSPRWRLVRESRAGALFRRTDFNPSEGHARIEVRATAN
jgi:hypothetical protein